MNAAAVGTVLAVIITAVLKVLLTRRDSKKKESRHVKDHPDNPAAVSGFGNWVRRAKERIDGNL